MLVKANRILPFIQNFNLICMKKIIQELINFRDGLKEQKDIEFIDKIITDLKKKRFMNSEPLSVLIGLFIVKLVEHRTLELSSESVAEVYRILKELIDNAR